MPERVIVVTGFGPFGEHTVNASWSAVQLLPRLWKPTDNDGIELLVEEIPVSYDFVSSEVFPEKWESKRKVEAVVHVGVSSYDQNIRIETLAHNHGYKRPDIFGKCPSMNKCVSRDCDENVLKTTFDEKDLIRSLQTSDIRCRGLSSENAGRYLCEFVYYKSLSNMEGKSLFIHVPPLNEPYTKEEMAEAITAILKRIVIQLKTKSIREAREK